MRAQNTLASHLTVVLSVWGEGLPSAILSAWGTQANFKAWFGCIRRELNSLTHPYSLTHTLS